MEIFIKIMDYIVAILRGLLNCATMVSTFVIMFIFGLKQMQDVTDIVSGEIITVMVFLFSFSVACIVGHYCWGKNE